MWLAARTYRKHQTLDHGSPSRSRTSPPVSDNADSEDDKSDTSEAEVLRELLLEDPSGAHGCDGDVFFGEKIVKDCPLGDSETGPFDNLRQVTLMNYDCL